MRNAVLAVAAVVTAACGMPAPVGDAGLSPQQRADQLARLGQLAGTFETRVTCAAGLCARRTSATTSATAVTLTWATADGAGVPGPCPVAFAIDLARDVTYSDALRRTDVSSARASVPPGCAVGSAPCDGAGGSLDWDSASDTLTATVSLSCGGMAYTFDLGGGRVAR